jgi:methyl-accepting chemotaxis protein
MASLGMKIIGGVAVAGIVSAATAGAGAYALKRLSGELGDALNSAQLVRAHLEADMMHDAIRADVIAALEATIIGSGFDIAEVAADFAEHSARFSNQLSVSKALARDPGTQAALKAVEEPLVAYRDSAQVIVDKAASDPYGAREGLADFMKQFSVLEEAMSAASDKIEADAAAQGERAVGFAAMATTLMLGLLVLAGAIAVAIAMVARRQVVLPLLRITSVLDRLARGDLGAEPPAIASNDEIGQMNKALHAFRQAVIDRQSELEAADQREALETERARNDEIQAEQRRVQTEVVTAIASGLSRLAHGDLVHRIDTPFPAQYESLRSDFNGAVASLADAVKGIHHAASGIRSGSGEISKASDDLSLRTQQQASSLEETAAALNQITATVRSTAAGAEEAHNAVILANKEVDAGGAVVRSAIDAMSTIEKSSGEIGQIIGVIDEIAFQTNLLALNAGVEAARAGEAGRGFAVVASEVRALAQRSAEAAKQIKGLITASANQVTTGVDLVAKTGDVLQRLAVAMSNINGVVSQIASTAREQAGGVAEVNTAIDQMDRATQQNAAMVEETTAASHSLAREAEELSHLVGRFKVELANDQGARRPAARPRLVEVSGSAVRAGTARELQASLAKDGWQN